jgi:3-deoxy-D-manno-octulosonic-acid transferase
MLRLLYMAAVALAAPLALGFTALRGLADPAYRDRLGERFGYTKAAFASRPIWVHAVSVGEIQAAAVLVRALRQRYPQHPLLITTATPTGAQRAAALFGDFATHAYLPYDTGRAVKRFLARVQPRMAVVMEREIWPTLFRECARRSIPVVLASARISAASAERHARLAGVFAPALATNVTVAAQTAADAERYRALGADPAAVHVVGNIKFDLETPVEARRDGAALREAQLQNRPVWVAGSTHEGEEDILLDAHDRVRARRSDALLILAPRHPNRFAQLQARLRERGANFTTRSSGAPIERSHAVLLGDTLGELTMFYAAADVAFVAGSLAPIGGHNLLEPAALARPIVVGPHNFNAPEIAAAMLEAGAAVQAASREEIADAVATLLEDPARREEMGARGAQVVARNRGALGRLMELIEKGLGTGD